VEGDDDVQLVAFAHSNPAYDVQADIARWPQGSLSRSTPVGEAIRENRPVLIADVDPDVLESLLLDDGPTAVVEAMGIRSLLVVPLPGPSGPIGALGFGFGESGRSYSAEDIAIAQELARRSAPAVEHALRFEREQATAEALQRTLLPERLPEVPELRFAARYLPGTLGLKVGGDWYDALTLPDGRVLLAIGDVVGHGVRAAAAMGRLRHALQFCAFDRSDAAEIVSRMNHHFSSMPDPEMATLLVVMLDADRSRVTYCSAGHPPPFLRTADGRVERLDGGRGMPLCAAASAKYHTAEAAISDGSVLLLYTDGLVERRGESLDVGFARLADAFRTGPSLLDPLADDVIARLLGGRGRDDDVALLAVAFDTGSIDRIDLQVAAERRARVRAAGCLVHRRRPAPARGDQRRGRGPGAVAPAPGAREPRSRPRPRAGAHGRRAGPHG
jgi:serine phosphatase RsbU (regulator of sigma subunit)